MEHLNAAMDVSECLSEVEVILGLSMLDDQCFGVAGGVRSHPIIIMLNSLRARSESKSLQIPFFV